MKETAVVIINGQSYVYLADDLYVHLHITPAPGGVTLSFRGPFQLEDLPGDSKQQHVEQLAAIHLMKSEQEQNHDD